jgi:hypothetical protein
MALSPEKTDRIAGDSSAAWAGSVSVVDHRADVDEGGKTYVTYIVNVSPQDLSEESWTVNRRYSQFAELYSNMLAAPRGTYPGFDKYSFPNKSMFHNSDIRTIERRKAGFDALLKIALKASPLPATVISFLKIGEHTGTRSSVASPAAYATPDGKALMKPPGVTRDPSFGALDSFADVEPPEFDLALLRILSIEATKLKDVELVGGNDAFVTLAFDKYRGKTKTIDGAGKNASWNTAGDSAFQFDVTADSLRDMVLKVGAYDDNKLKSAVFIGQGAVSLADVLTLGFDCETSLNVVLKDAKDQFAGNVVIRFDLVEHPDVISKELTRAQVGGVAFALFYISLYAVSRLLYLIATFDYRRSWIFLKAVALRQGFRWICYTQTVLFLGVFFVFLHRMLGKGLTMLLQSIMMTPSGGYNMSFNWLSLRLGLDESEIVLKDFVWHNTPQFTESPFFVKVKRLAIRFNPNTFVNAVLKGTPISVTDIDIDGVVVYIERHAVYGLNLWACLGADNQKSDNKIESSVVGNVSSAIKKVATLEKQGDAGTEGASKPPMLSKLDSTLRDSMFFDEADLKTDDENLKDAKEPSKRPGKVSKQASVAAMNADGTVKTSAWGVPFTFIVSKLHMTGLLVHAQDYLNASHMSYSKLNAIQIRQMAMGRKEFSNPSSSGGPDKGIFLDDLVWRLVGQLVTTLLTANSGSLAIIAGKFLIISIEFESFYCAR